MNIYVVTKNLTIPILEDYKYNERRDGGLDTINVNFYYNEPNVLPRYAWIQFDSKEWRVMGKPTVKINYDSTNPRWLYSVVLIEKADELKGVPLPNLSFTQPLANNVTLSQALIKLLKKQEVKEVGFVQRYTLSTSGANKLSGLMPNETFKQKNLYELLKWFGDIIDAKPILLSNNQIDFEYYNDYDGLITPDITTIEINEPMEEYATDILIDAENVDLGAVKPDPNAILNYSMHPSRVSTVKLIPRNMGEDLTWANATLVLPEKIKQVLAMSVESTNNFDVSYGIGIVEKTEWETLDDDQFWTFIPYIFGTKTKKSTLYYEYGNNEILNLQALSERVEGSNNPREYKISILYTPLVDIQIRAEQDNFLDGDIRYIERQTQSSTTLSLDEELKRLDFELAKKQNPTLKVGFVTSTKPNKKNRISVLDNDWLITELISEKVGNKFRCDAVLSLEYNYKNPLTKVYVENPIFEIPDTQVVDRKVIIEDKINVTLTLNQMPQYDGNDYWSSNQRWKMLLPFEEDEQRIPICEYRYETPVSNAIDFQYDDADDEIVVAEYVSAIAPARQIVVNNRLISKWQMITNTSIGAIRYDTWRDPALISVRATANSAIITDANGELKSFRLKYGKNVADDDITFTKGITDISFSQTNPFISQDYYSNLQSYYSKYFQLDKDRRERLVFEHNFVLYGDIGESTPTTVHYNNFFQASSLLECIPVTKIRFTYDNDTQVTISGADVNITTTSGQLAIIVYSNATVGLVKKVELIVSFALGDGITTQDGVILERSFNNVSLVANGYLVVKFERRY